MMQAPCYLKKLIAQWGVEAGFVGRIAGVPVDRDREVTLARLQPAHQEVINEMGFDWEELYRAEQVHGAEVAVIEAGDEGRVCPSVDGLITSELGLLLGIYVADCGAVYIADPVKGVIALLHSGKKGTEGNITGKAIAMMQQRFGCRPDNLEVVLAPCIRPPAYEVDFASQIREQVEAAGVPSDQWTDCGICTSSDLNSYYSYRVEKGDTGRMLALLGRKVPKV